MMVQQASLGLKIVHTIITAWKWSTEAERSSYNTYKDYGICQHWMVSCYCVYSGDIPLYSNNILLVSRVINYDIAVLPNPLIVLPQKCSSLELRRKIMLQIYRYISTYWPNCTAKQMQFYVNDLSMRSSKRLPKQSYQTCNFPTKNKPVNVLQLLCSTKK